MPKILYATALGLVIAAVGCAVAIAADAPRQDAKAPPPGVGAPPAPAHAAAEEGGEPDPTKASPDLAVWTLVVFVILLAVLWRFAWGPISQGLSRREQRIADQITQAEQANQHARDLLAQYEKKLVDSQNEVRAILEQARRDAEQVGRKMLDSARADAEQERQRALRDIDTATAGALKELAERSAALAVELAGRIVQQQLDARGHARLIQQAMRDFTAVPTAARS
jgi:F-type H+-transporting ATPase subunit b